MTPPFDFAVLGAGSAGSVIASRLSEDASCRVVLIEAGHWPDDPDIADPLKWPALQGRDYDWAYRTTAQSHTANRGHNWPRGKIVGGSSCLHAMAYVRGHAMDFDNWAEAGGPGWSWQGLLEGFQRAENFVARGGTGPLDIIEPDGDVSPVVRAYMAAGQALGVPIIAGHNGGELIGTTPNALTLRRGQRLSLAAAYLTSEVLARPNLTVLTGREIERLAITGSRATGVLTEHAGIAELITADHIVLCAGAVSSPLILMRSGIGDAATLQRAGIRCLAGLRDVGCNLQDHLLVLGNIYLARKAVPPSRLQHSESLMYLASGDLSAKSGPADIVLACAVAPIAAEGLCAPPYGTAYSILCGITHPASRGHIAVTGPGRHDAPIIDPHYLESEEDRRGFRAALRTARLIGHHAGLDDWRDHEVLPGPSCSSDDELDAFIARTASTHHHPAGTCRMGRDRQAVVDPRLRLNGFDNISIVDASIMPTLPSGPINAAVVAIAETWSRLSREPAVL